VTGARRPRSSGRRRFAAVAVLAAASACASRAPSAEPRDGDGPTIERIEPDTIALGRQAVPTIVLRGTGFVPGGNGEFGGGRNTVRVGPASVERVASDAGGTTLRFALALAYSDTSSRGRPASFVPGEYPVSVITPRGTSNTLTLTMIR
jgi:hypothetical protein